MHYKDCHNQILSEKNTIHQIHREFCPEDYPDLDFNNGYGLNFTRQTVTRASERLSGYWQTYIKTPALIYHDSRNIIDHHREAFFDFFGLDPISLHSHVSDTHVPHLLTSLICHLKKFLSQQSDSVKALVPNSAFNISKEARAGPRFAVARNSYSTGFGPSAYDASCPWLKAAACGEPFHKLDLNVRNLDHEIANAKSQRCVAFVVEIVQSTGGVVISAAQWQAIVHACRRHRMFLVVDEAMTAVRCGAPFAHQLEQYKEYGRPDFVFFGKGIRACGIAVDWEGINIAQARWTARKDQVEAAIMWQKRFTEIAAPEILLQSWGTILLAKQQDWPQRAIRIGKILRAVLTNVCADPSSIKGLHSLIHFRQSDQGPKDLHVVPASAGPTYTRWLPVLDPVMCSETDLQTKTFGLASLSHRRQLAKYLREHGWAIGYCSRCGDSMEVGDDREGARAPCEFCLTKPCEQCEPGDHICQFDKNEERDA